MNKFCIGFCNDKKPNAGHKAQIDAIEIASQASGYSYIPFTCKGEDFIIGNIRPLLEFHVFSSFLKRLRHLSNTILFINHPISLYFMVWGGYNFLAKKNKIILLSHDLNHLRGKTYDARKMKQLCRASCIITHNVKYSSYLKQIGIKVPLIPIHIFDYLISDTTSTSKKTFKKKVSFVGALCKSTFLNKLVLEPHSYELELIGECSQEQNSIFSSSNCNYKGPFPSNIVHEKLEGSFGLVWDGDSIDTCSGPYGEYLRYNNPHKTSLYLACSMPVFIWSQAALAGFIKENKVGFLIDKLDDIEKILDTLTQADYEELQKNIKPIQEKITHGWYLQQALAKAEQVVLTE